MKNRPLSMGGGPISDIMWYGPRLTTYDAEGTSRKIKNFLKTLYFLCARNMTFMKIYSGYIAYLDEK